MTLPIPLMSIHHLNHRLNGHCTEQICKTNIKSVESITLVEKTTELHDLAFYGSTKEVISLISQKTAELVKNLDRGKYGS